MSYRIGVATSDGIVVNQHFGHAEQFLILDVDENNQLKIVEMRHTEAVCHGGNHDDNQLEQSAKRLSDCDFLLVSQIGQGAVNALKREGISVYEIPGMIEESVKKLLAYVEVQKLLAS